MHEKAIEYLKHLHGLEVAAGRNFNSVWKDLFNRRRLEPELARDLVEAKHQEMAHARLVRRMLGVFGYENTPELMQLPMEIIDGLPAAVPEPWPEEMQPYAMICFNHEFEKRFSGGGVAKFYTDMERYSRMIPPKQGFMLMEHVYKFLLMVEADERWHVEVDRRAMDVYEDIHGGFDMVGLLAKAQVARSPATRKFIRAKQSFLLSIA